MDENENKTDERIVALSCIVADLKTENEKLVKRTTELMDDYNKVVEMLDERVKQNSSVDYLQDEKERRKREIEKMNEVYELLVEKKHELEIRNKSYELQYDSVRNLVKERDSLHLEIEALNKDISFLNYKLTRYQEFVLLEKGIDCPYHCKQPKRFDLVVTGSADCYRCYHNIRFEPTDEKFVFCVAEYDMSDAEENSDSNKE